MANDELVQFTFIVLNVFWVFLPQKSMPRKSTSFAYPIEKTSIKKFSIRRRTVSDTLNLMAFTLQERYEHLPITIVFSFIIMAHWRTDQKGKIMKKSRSVVFVLWIYSVCFAVNSFQVTYFSCPINYSPNAQGRA